MAAEMAGFPYWQVWFDEKGKPDKYKWDTLLAQVPQEKLSDLFIFSHGWNNDSKTAESMYASFFQQLADVMQARGVVRSGIGVVGVIWPSMRWADEAPASAAATRGRGGAASVSARPRARAAVKSDGDLARDLKAVFTKPKQKKAIDAMAKLLEERPNDPKARAKFQKLMAELAPRKLPAEDDGDNKLLTEKPDVVFRHMATASVRDRSGGAAGLLDPLWDGAKEALRAATYWQMKERAGVVGQNGLAPLIGAIHKADPKVRIHLIGHSFGARLVSFSLAGLPASSAGSASPVKSLTLLQGAFSHFAFADSLPFDRGKGGALKGMAARVDGPIIASHSLKDSAVCELYPLASFLARQAASAAGRKVSKWGAMGGDGAQAVNATGLSFLDVGQPYPFQPGKFFNLDGNQLIVKGGPPSGAHSDIIYDKIAWAVMRAAGIG